MTSDNQNSLGSGVVAGFAATVVLSAVMLMKQAMGIMPDVSASDSVAGRVFDRGSV